MDPSRSPQRRAFWLRQLHQWHWISSAICLVGMLLFAVTGITLNHAGQIEATPRVLQQSAQVPEEILAGLAAPDDGKAPLPAALRDWLSQQLSLRVDERIAEWSADEVYVSLPRPGGDGWLSLDRQTGEVAYESTDRGWISWFNDLHKGRNTGVAWSWFIDAFAVGCVVFCVSGLLLLQVHSRQRPATWPMVGLGALVMLLIVLLFVH